MAIARELLPMKPALLVISALTRREAEEGAEELRRTSPGTEIVAEWGNLFGPLAFKDAGRDAMQDAPAARGALLDDLFGPLGDDALPRSALGDLVLRHRPEVMIDCVNT